MPGPAIPTAIDTLMMYMSNMAWNSSMNTVETIRMLTDHDEAGTYKIPFIIYSDAYYSETVPFADLVLPDTTYLERHDCISLLDRPISHADGPGDAIRHPVVEPDRDVRPFQSVLIELGARLGLHGFVDEDGSAKYSDYADYIVNHERTPGIGPLAGWRGKDGTAIGKGEANPDQLQRYIDNGGFWHHDFADDQRYYKMANRSYLHFAESMGFIPKAEPIVFQLYSEPLQRFRLAARGHGRVVPPEQRTPAHRDLHGPAAVLVRAVRGSGGRPRKISAACADAATDAHVPFLGFAECVAAADHQPEPAVRASPGRRRPRSGRRRPGLSIGKAVQEQIELIDARRTSAGLRPWNAIGKRRGSWGLKDDAAESNRGFLLNRIIGDQTRPTRGANAIRIPIR